MSDDTLPGDHRTGRMQQSMNNISARFDVEDLIFQMRRGGLTEEDISSAFEYSDPAELEGLYSVECVLIHSSDPNFPPATATMPIEPLDFDCAIRLQFVRYTIPTDFPLSSAG